jgi:hypothetical protein
MWSCEFWRLRRGSVDVTRRNKITCELQATVSRKSSMYIAANSIYCFTTYAQQLTWMKARYSIIVTRSTLMVGNFQRLKCADMVQNVRAFLKWQLGIMMCWEPKANEMEIISRLLTKIDSEKWHSFSISSKARAFYHWLIVVTTVRKVASEINVPRVFGIQTIDNSSEAVVNSWI